MLHTSLKNTHTHTTHSGKDFGMVLYWMLGDGEDVLVTYPLYKDKY